MQHVNQPSEENKQTVSRQTTKDRLPLKRKLIQLYAALLYNANVKGFAEGQIYTGQLKNVCVPGFNCYSCPGAIGACPLGALQNALASSTTRLPAYVFGTLILFGLLLGRTICGFICPLGLIQELLFKIPTPKLGKNKFTRALTWVKYVILGVFVVLIPLYFALDHLPLPAFCKYICPAGTLEGAIGLLSNPVNESKLSMLGILFTRKFIIMVVMILSAVFIYRVFCRFLCPLGAIYGFFCRVAMVGVHVDEQTCIDCGLCVRTCKMDVKRVGDHECIHCGDCISCCPKKCISFHVGSKELGVKKVMSSSTDTGLTGTVTYADSSGNRVQNKDGFKKKSIMYAPWIIAVVFLIGVLWYVNKPTEVAMGQGGSFQTATTSSVDSTGEVTSSDMAEQTAAGETGVASAGQITGTLGDGTSTDDTSIDGASSVGTTVEVGKEVGMQLPDFTASVYGGETFESTSVRGKILVLNFWATWCTPCVAELPYFAQAAADYPDEVQIIAMHSSLVTEDVEAWINREEIPLTFALDETGDIITSLGGSTMLPMTVIVDADGIITYNAVGSLTYEKLQGLIQEAMKD